MKYPVDEYALDSFVRHTAEDAWRAGNPALIDKRMEQLKKFSRTLKERDARAFCTMHVLQAEPMKTVREFVEAQLNDGVSVNVGNLDALAEYVRLNRRPLQQMEQLAQSFAVSTSIQLENYAQNPQVTDDLKAVSMALVEADKKYGSAIEPPKGQGPRAQRQRATAG